MNIKKAKFLTLSFICVGLTQAQVTWREDQVGQLLNQWYKEGTAAGLAEITYENRDSGHSLLEDQYPQIKRFAHDKTTGVANAMAHQLRDFPVIGNSSMAMNALELGSLPRMYMLQPQGMKFLATQLVSNNLFIYPEHQDYDLGANGVDGYGDLYIGNSVNCVISQGASYSDLPFLRALVCTAAALSPAMQAKLIKEKQLAAVLQWIMRTCSKSVTKPELYMTQLAHPVVFDDSMLDEVKMIQMAHDLTPEKLPGYVFFEVVEESQYSMGTHYFEASDQIHCQQYTAPNALCRLMRANTGYYQIVLKLKMVSPASKAQVKAVVLQGRSNHTQIEQVPSKPDHIKITQFAQPPINLVNGILSHRTDIGLFAVGENNIGLPAIISFYHLPNERYIFNHKNQLINIDYQNHNSDLGLPRKINELRWVDLLEELHYPVKANFFNEKYSKSINKLTKAKWMDSVGKLVKLKKEYDLAKSNPKLKIEPQKVVLFKKLSEFMLTKENGKNYLDYFSEWVSKELESGDFFLNHQDEIFQLAAASENKVALTDLDASILKLVNLKVLFLNEQKQYEICKEIKDHPEVIKHYISGLNLDILSQILLVRGLKREVGPAYCSKLLTIPKDWRDQRIYTEDGKLKGWLRYYNNQIYAFNPEGKILPNGINDLNATLPAEYFVTQDHKLGWRIKP
jgi:hypothetical protein